MAMSMEDKKTRFLIITTAVIAILLLYFFIDARENQLFPKCPFRSFTGLYCPGCGSQRAISSLLHFDISAALRYNILLVASLPLVIYSGYAAVMNTFTSVRVEQKLFHSVFFIRMVALIVVTFSILRNLHMYPFNFLAPHP
jgi:hypothetical protein